MLNLVAILCFPAAVAFLLESITPGAPRPAPGPACLGVPQERCRPATGALLWGVEAVA